MMTNWNQIKKLAGPNAEVFPGGESVYLFCSTERLAPPELQGHTESDEVRAWCESFRKEANEHGLDVEIRQGHVYVVVPV